MPLFRPHEHLRKPQEFQAVYDRRRSSADGTLIVYTRANGFAYSRIGLSVSKKFGQAVQRNRIRRLLREAYRLTKEALPAGYDYVFIPRQQEEYTLEAFRKAMKKLIPQTVRKMARERSEPEAAP